ncbi:hypothetical protein BN946_scf184298.g10 [Trametes cinnabarina]|uniref:Lytic polysaccharide monooxygenase n=1 Tax=Pycnoporus cinnabarinus TaxID=5643 RepID=A0A060SWU0_PYCCI|nr:hypothetical protein BN946_scf184298.g10 [Trametes cinnabarina]
MFAPLLIALAGTLPLASGHASFWHNSMYGFNVTDKTFPYDNRPVSPLTNYTFDQWWFHGHLDYPPHPGDFFELPAGKPATAEIACNKGATTWFNSSEGGNIQEGNNPCPNSPTSAYHTTGLSDLKGCAMAIAYESDVTKIKPEDFTVFSVNQTCVWTRFTDFQVPERMPPCPPGGCHCAWFWIHSQDSGGEQNYMTGFKCNVTGSTSNVPLAKPQVPRRCGADPDNGKPNAAPGNCTYGAKQPFYWFQAEQNNMFEGTYSPPFYLDLYNFKDGAQNDIFVDSYPNGLPAPSPNSTFVPTPFLGNGSPQPTGDAGLSSYSAPASSNVVSTSTGVSASPSLALTSAISSSAASASSGATSSVATSAPLSASALSQTTTLSSTPSTALSPDLPVSTTSASLPTESISSASDTATSEAVSTSVAVTTSTVISTLVVTVTAGSPGASSSSDALPVSALSSTLLSPASMSLSSSALTASSSTILSTTPATSFASSSVQGFQTAGPTTIFLNRPTSAAASSAASSSAGAEQAAPTTIDLNFAVSDDHSYSVKSGVRPGVLAAAPSDGTCKRQFRRKVALRRRADPLDAPQARSVDEDTREPTILSRISLPYLHRHRKLQERSSLWRLF